MEKDSTLYQLMGIHMNGITNGDQKYQTIPRRSIVYSSSKTVITHFPPMLQFAPALPHKCRQFLAPRRSAAANKEYFYRLELSFYKPLNLDISIFPALFHFCFLPLICIIHYKSTQIHGQMI